MQRFLETFRLAAALMAAAPLAAQTPANYTNPLGVSGDLLDWGADPVWASTGAANLPGEVAVGDSVDLPPGNPRFLRLSVSRN